MKLPEPEYVPTTDAYGRNTYREYYTAAQMIAFRNAALEEAASVVLKQWSEGRRVHGSDYAEAIRALKEVQS